MLLEATMLYTSFFMISEECDNGTGPVKKITYGGRGSDPTTTSTFSGMNKNKIHSILKALERLLVKIECGVCCKNC